MIWHRIARPMKRLATMNLTDAEKPSVDVMIPCYTEPVEVSHDIYTYTSTYTIVPEQ